MYLERRVSFDYSFRENSREALILVGDTTHCLAGSRLSSYTEEVAYWRKAYWLHEWLSNHVIGPIKNCQSYFLPLPALRSIALETQRVIANVSNSMFNFHTESDSDLLFYWAQVNYTYTTIHAELMRPPLENAYVSHYYRASW